MFKNRCCDRPVSYNQESSMMYSSEVDYPVAGAVQTPQSAPMHFGPSMQSGCEMPPIHECPQERVVNREFHHEVPHIVPINTRVINHHIYRHTYTPCYTCCEENVVCNVYDGCKNNF